MSSEVTSGHQLLFFVCLFVCLFVVVIFLGGGGEGHAPRPVQQFAGQCSGFPHLTQQILQPTCHSVESFFFFLLESEEHLEAG